MFIGSTDGLKRTQLREMVYPGESLYGKWSRLNLRRPRSKRELYFEFGLSNNTDVFSGWKLLEPSRLLPDGLENVVKMLGLDLKGFHAANGFDYLSTRLYPTSLNTVPWLKILDSDAARMISTELRYCPDCLNKLYHSAIFQHWAVERCPMHRIDLVDRCKICNHAIRVTGSTIVSDPFGCPSCGALLIQKQADRNYLIDENEIQQIVLKISESKRALMWLGSEGVKVSVSKRFKRNRVDSISSRSMIVNAQRHCSWVSQTVNNTRIFREETVRILFSTDSSNEILFDDSYHLAIQEILRIRNLFVERRDEIRTLIGRAGIDQTGIILEGSASVVGIAFCKALYYFGLEKADLEDDYTKCDTVLADYCCRRGIWDLKGNRQLVSMFIMADFRALFSLLLCETSRLKFLNNVVWTAVPEAESFQSSWCIEIVGGYKSIRVRPRSSPDLPDRLVARYCARMLHKKIAWNTSIDD